MKREETSQAAARSQRTQRKKDKRSIATERAIKDGFLSELDHTQYDQLTVSSVCARANVTRPTFYQHYGNLADVLDEVLTDMMYEIGDVPFELCATCTTTTTPSVDSAHLAQGNVRGVSHESVDSNTTRQPFCHFLLSQNKYHALLEDVGIVEKLITRIVDTGLDYAVDQLEQRFPNTSIDREQLRYFNIFRMSGCLAAAKAAKDAGYDWQHIQPMLDRAITSAFEAL